MAAGRKGLSVGLKAQRDARIHISDQRQIHKTRVRTFDDQYSNSLENKMSLGSDDSRFMNSEPKKNVRVSSSSHWVDAEPPLWTDSKNRDGLAPSLYRRAKDAPDQTAHASPLQSPAGLFQQGLPSVSSISNRPATPSMCQSTRQILLSCSPPSTVVRVTQRRRPVIDRQRLLPLLVNNFSTPSQGFNQDR